MLAVSEPSLPFSETPEEESREAAVHARVAERQKKTPENSRQLLTGFRDWLNFPLVPSSEQLGAYPEEPAGSEIFSRP